MTPHTEKNPLDRMGDKVAKNVDERVDVVVMGAGAAGLMCAATAGFRGRKVLVLDHAPKAAAKIRISGGGQCNFTNRTVTPEDYICANPHFVKSALARFTPEDFLALVELHGIEYEERDQGKLFCAQRAGDLIHMLQTQAKWAGAEIRVKTPVQSVIAPTQNAPGLVKTDSTNIACETLVVATGGKAYPKLKATDWGLRFAEQLGLSVRPTRPGLVPLHLDGAALAFCQSLAGNSLPVALQTADRQVRDQLLFTHQGLSGPAVLQLSNYWQPGQVVQIDWLPSQNALEALKALRGENGRLDRWLQTFWPKKMVQAWLKWYPDTPINLGEANNESLEAIARELHSASWYPVADGGYDKAEVMLGGVDTDAISSKTLAVKTHPKVHFIGEVLDVTGRLGGYNFQWAWASGHAAGSVA
ncbi:MAG: NAD(P)/FAD-dependent oxidoreductase [Hydrogenovibrio sp.]|uniref:NAD(P)/FAD-dependent oxidoreductase n=1 Tax=Hydrogenovibrio sp. TaxID=2065821 RepID=UPI0028702BFA|nr:NAD(P)/FAD-dependent oxidoreductase [Hydrogenovibrio sp.]MDR9498303.1 NAD(P)/FAD-dependent oxidoreductase [Hydrogenovibrio sp.]